METAIRRIRIFLASPMDVAEERKHVFPIIDALNHDPSIGGRVVIEIVAWDHPTNGAPILAGITPQKAIEQGLPKPSECDIVVVIFWARMGTPLPAQYVKPDGSRYLSGTEYEYLDAIAASQNSGSPLVLLYRRTEEPVIKLRDPDRYSKIEQWEVVEKFFANLTNSDGSLKEGINTYESVDDFQERLKKDLKSLILRLIQHPEKLIPYKGQPVVSAEITRLIEEFLNPKTKDARKVVIIDTLADFGSISVPALVEAAMLADMIDFSGMRTTIDESLKRFPEESLHSLIEALKNTKDNGVRGRIIETLRILGHRGAEPTLIKVLQEPVSQGTFLFENPLVNAAQALGTIGGPAAIPALVTALSNTSEYVRAAAAQALGKLGDKSVVRPLIDLLKDTDSGVKVEAATGLGELGDISAVPYLRELVRIKPDEELILEDPRVAAAKALAKLHDFQSAGIICALLKEKDSNIRMEIVKALALLHNPAAVPEIGKLIHDKNEMVRGEVIKALGVHGDQKGVPILRQALQEGDEDNDEVIKALERIGGDKASEALAIGLDNREYSNRSYIVDALTRIGGDAAINGLVKAFNDKEEYVRDSAVTGLIKIGTAPAIQALLKALRNPKVFIDVAEIENNEAGEFQDFTRKIIYPYTIVAAISAAYFMPEADRQRALTYFKSMPDTIPAILKGLEITNASFSSKTTYALELAASQTILPKVVKLLSSTNSVTRSNVVAALGKFKEPEIVQPLIHALDDSNEIVRACAADALGQSGFIEGIPALQKALKDNISQVRIAAACAIGALKHSPSTPLIADLLNDADKQVRCAAISAMGAIGDRSASAYLEPWLEGNDEDDLINTLGALGQLMDANSDLAILNFIQKPDHCTNDKLIEASIRAMEKTKNPQALEFIVTALKSLNGQIRYAAISALGESGSSSAIPPLIQCLEENTDSFFVQSAIQKIGGPDIVTALIDLYKKTNNVSVRGQIAQILGELKDRKAIPTLLARLPLAAFSEQGDIIKALGLIGDPAVVPKLIDLVNKADETFFIFTKVLKVLGDLKDRSAVPCLIRALSYSNYDSQRDAAQALKKIGTSEALAAIKNLPAWYLKEASD